MPTGSVSLLLPPCRHHSCLPTAEKPTAGDGLGLALGGDRDQPSGQGLHTWDKCTERNEVEFVTLMDVESLLQGLVYDLRRLRLAGQHNQARRTDILIQRYQQHRKVSQT